MAWAFALPLPPWRRGVAWRGVAGTLIRTDTTLDHNLKAGKKRSWDIPGKSDTLRGMAWRGMALPVALAFALALLRPRPQPRCRRRRWRWRWNWHWRWRCVSLGLGLCLGLGIGVGIGIGVAWRGVAWRGEAAWRVTLIRTDTTLDHSQKAEKKRDWDITITGNGGTLRGMALALHRRWRWR